MSTNPVWSCPGCGGYLRLGEGYGPFRNHCSSKCLMLVKYGPPAPYRPRRTPLGLIPGVDPLTAHYGDHGTTEPLIPLDQWPVGTGDIVTDQHGRQGQVVRRWWATKHIDRDAVWESCVEVVPGRVGETSLGRAAHGRSSFYRVTDLTVVTRWADLDG